jgi:hypothetical protein
MLLSRPQLYKKVSGVWQKLMTVLAALCDHSECCNLANGIK